MARPCRAGAAAEADARRRIACLVAALVLLGPVSGGGSGSAASSTTAPRPSPAAAATPSPAAPRGKLSAAEYAALIRISRQSDALDHLKGAKLVRGFGQICAAFARAPRTQLLKADGRLCVRGKRFVQALRAFVTQQRGCKAAAAAGDISCFAELFSRVARTTRVTLVSSRQVNAELARRGLSGTCAKGVGSSSAKDMKNAQLLGRTARIASQALYARDQARYAAAGSEFIAALRAADASDNTSSVAQVRKCPHD